MASHCTVSMLKLSWLIYLPSKTSITTTQAAASIKACWVPCWNNLSDPYPLGEYQVDCYRVTSINCIRELHQTPESINNTVDGVPL